MNIYCKGSGSPAVILEAGLGGDTTSWATVQPSIAAKTRTCAEWPCILTARFDGGGWVAMWQDRSYTRNPNRPRYSLGVSCTPRLKILLKVETS